MNRSNFKKKSYVETIFEFAFAVIVLLAIVLCVKAQSSKVNNQINELESKLNNQIKIEQIAKLNVRTQWDY